MTTPLKRRAGDIPSSTSGKKPRNAPITAFFASSSPAKPASSQASSNDVAPSSTETSTNGADLEHSAQTTERPDDNASIETAKSAENGTNKILSAAQAAPIFSAAFQSSAPATATTAANFDKNAWVAKLSSEHKDLLALEIETLDPSWLAHLKDELVSRDFLDLKRFLKAEHMAGKKIFPPAPDVYSWSRHTPLHNVKVVILGQDPYHNENQAHGLCFSVRPPTVAPPSLLNMYKLLKSEYPAFQPPPNRGGLLTPWADRGVLLLNTCLTVRAHEANSHAGKGWEKFTQKVIDTVAKQRSKGVVFLAWGKPAQTKVAKVDKKRHHVLQSVHPSPLSAARGFVRSIYFCQAIAV